MDKVTLRDAIEALDMAVTNTLVYFNQADVSDIPTLLRAFGQLKDNKEKLDHLAETLGECYNNLSYEVIPNAFGADQPEPKIESVKVAGRNFILSSRINASIPEYMRDAGHKWLTDDAKIPELIIPRTNPKQLSSFVKSYFEANGKWPPETAIKVHKQNFIMVRKA